MCMTVAYVRVMTSENTLSMANTDHLSICSSGLSTFFLSCGNHPNGLVVRASALDCREPQFK